MRSLWSSVLLVLTSGLVAGNGGRVWFSENRGQWPEQVLFRAALQNGALFVERDALTFVVTDGGYSHFHEEPKHPHGEEPFRAHAYRMRFVDGQSTAWSGSRTASHHENYFLGNDPARWVGKVPVHGEVLLKDLYPGIDLRITGSEALK